MWRWKLSAGLGPVEFPKNIDACPALGGELERVWRHGMTVDCTEYSVACDGQGPDDKSPAHDQTTL